MSKIFILIVVKPVVFLTPLIVIKLSLFESSFSPFSLINLEFIIETFEPESYIPNISNCEFNNSLTLINGVIIRFFYYYN